MAKFIPERTHGAVPATSLTDKIYGPQSTGTYGAYQYEPVWWRDTYNPPGYTICTAGLTPAYSTAYLPPAYRPAVAVTSPAEYMAGAIPPIAGDRRPQRF